MAHKENGNKVVQQWLAPTNINPAQRALCLALEIKSFEAVSESRATNINPAQRPLFALEIKSFRNLQPSEKASSLLP